MKTKDSEEIVSYMDVTLPYVVDECFYVNEECWKEWQAVGADHVFDRSPTSTPSDRSEDREFFVVELVKRAAQSDRVSSTPGIFETSKTYPAGLGSAGKRSRGVAESKMDVYGEEL